MLLFLPVLLSPLVLLIKLRCLACEEYIFATSWFPNYMVFFNPSVKQFFFLLREHSMIFFCSGNIHSPFMASCAFFRAQTLRWMQLISNLMGRLPRWLLAYSLVSSYLMACPLLPLTGKNKAKHAATVSEYFLFGNRPFLYTSFFWLLLFYLPSHNDKRSHAVNSYSLIHNKVRGFSKGWLWIVQQLVQSWKWNH